VPILKENVDRGRWLATGIGFVGIVVVLNPSGIDFHPAILWLLFSSLLFALLDVFNKKYVSKESMLHMLFYTAFFTTVLSLTPALWTWHPMRAAQWGWLLAIGCGANLLLYCLLKSLQHMEASALAPFRYVDFGVSAFLGFLFFRETPSLHTCMGLVIIVPSTLFLAIREARKEQASP
jgi:drug/metabolite transporter (DMT)-like permease